MRVQDHMDQLINKARKHRKECGPANVKLMNAANVIEKQMEADKLTNQVNDLLGTPTKAPVEVAKPISKVTEAWLDEMNENEQQPQEVK